MTRCLALAAALTLTALAAAPLASAGEASPHASPGKTVTLPGLSYQVLASGPAGGAHPKRSDTVRMRYVGRLGPGVPGGGEVFSTSPDDGKGLSTFAVGQLIPGMNAALQLMRPGDRWRVTMPPYLAYGPGRPLGTPAPANAAGQTVQKHGIPPDATLVFDVELVEIAAPAA